VVQPGHRFDVVGGERRPAISAISASSARTHDIITVLKFAISSLAERGGRRLDNGVPERFEGVAASVAAATQTGSVAARSPACSCGCRCEASASAPSSLAQARAAVR
jgi:hypothetical protein